MEPDVRELEGSGVVFSILGTVQYLSSQYMSQ